MKNGANELLKKAEAFEEKGNYSKAEQYYRKALAIQERNLEAEPDQLIPFLYNHGMILGALERNDEAYITLKRTLNLCITYLGEENDDVAELKSVIADIGEETLGLFYQQQQVVNA